jgi:hypothetical protein
MKNQFDGGTAIVEAFRKLGVEYILSCFKSRRIVWDCRKEFSV